MLSGGRLLSLALGRGAQICSLMNMYADYAHACRSFGFLPPISHNTHGPSPTVTAARLRGFSVLRQNQRPQVSGTVSRGLSHPSTPRRNDSSVLISICMRTITLDLDETPPSLPHARLRSNAPHPTPHRPSSLPITHTPTP